MATKLILAAVQDSLLFDGLNEVGRCRLTL
jgi:hypothetical protein